MSVVPHLIARKAALCVAACSLLDSPLTMLQLVLLHCPSLLTPLTPVGGHPRALPELQQHQEFYFISPVHRTLRLTATDTPAKNWCR